MLTPEQEKIAALEGQVAALRETLFKLADSIELAAKQLDKFETMFSGSDLRELRLFMRAHPDIFPEIERDAAGLYADEPKA